MENVKILLLDDREENLIALNAILNRDDIQVFLTTSPNEALRLVWENDISIAIVDVQMPGMDGFEFAQMLASNPKTKEILILFVTAISKETTYAVKGLKAGAIDYLYKPLDPYITNAKIDSLIRLSQSQREIREKNKLLKNYETIVTNSPDIIATVEPETGKILSINPSVEAILGRKPSDLLHTSILSLLVEPIGSPLQQVMVNREYTYGETRVVEDRFSGHLHQSVWLELRIMYKDKTLFVNLHDIEQRKIRERELIQAQNEAERSQRSKETFLANMSHEIRTPLNGIIGISNLLENSDLNDAQSSLLKLLTNSTSSLMNIVNDILDISKIDQGKFSIVPFPTNIHITANDVCNLMQFRAEEKGLKMSCYVEQSVPENLLIDEMRLKQILLNLLGNALKFTSKGAVSLKMRYEGFHAGKHTIRFEVVDTGIGISEESLANIFAEYGQATNETASKYGGTGLGLTISQKLVSLMGGELRVESEEGKGSKFYFVLELSEANLGIVKSSAPIPYNKLPPFSGKRILIAEDNRINGLLLEKYLGAWDISTKWVLNGREAVEAMSESAYDMIVMDTKMPEMDGFQAARYARQNLHIDTPILSLSATILPEEVEEAILSGMNDALSKPFDPVQLHNKISLLMK